MSTDINISLEAHLLHGLNLVSPILPEHLTSNLAQYLVSPPPLTIPYKTLFAISQWTRTIEGQKALLAHSMKPHDYSMISLLAGTTSSPEGKFGTYIPPKEPEQIEAERVNERKSITALMNALLSIGGVAFAVWWAADKTGWRNEWVRSYSHFLNMFSFLLDVSESFSHYLQQSW
jgi:TMEM199 family protein